VSLGILGSIFLLATFLAFVYRLRTFCLYLCPVSGFLGLYSMASMIALRCVDPEVCKKECKTKNCRMGGENGWACPWFQYLGKMDRNNYCGLCMECVKSCPNDNVGLFTRRFCADTEIKGYDESWKAFIMLSLAMIYAMIFLGPSGTVKDWANVTEVGNWKGFLAYAGILWFTALVAIPAVWALACWLGQCLSGTKSVPVKDLFRRYSFLLVPLGLMGWIAFSFPLIMVNGSYIVSVASDPLGWGWNLFGTAELAWTPVLPEYTVFVQIPLLLVGLVVALKRGYEIARTLYPDDRQAIRSLIPVGVVCAGVVVVFLKLFVG